MKKYNSFEIASVYLAAFVQGIGNLSFPASAAVFKSHHGFSDAQYGFLFIPMICFAVLSAFGGTLLQRRLSLKTIFATGVGLYMLSQIFLAVSFVPQSYGLAVLAISVMGLGFGFTGIAVTYYPTLMFPKRQDAAIILVHVAFGIGATLAPALMGVAIGSGVWLGFPIGAAMFMALVLILVVTQPLEAEPHVDSLSSTAVKTGEASQAIPVGLWLFCAMAVVYALSESTVTNWSVIFLQESKGLPEDAANFSLSLFWLWMTIGRVVVSLISIRFNSDKIYLALPVVTAAAFLLIPTIGSAVQGYVWFSLAGVGCSAFYPLTVSLAIKKFPTHAAKIGGLMSGFVMIGIGLASYAIAPLRSIVTLNTIYAASAIYPIASLVIAVIVMRRK